MGGGGSTTKKLLIVYDSWSCGNTERIAKILQCTAGGDLWKLDTAEPYRGSYSEVVDQGQREVERGLEPELKPLGVDPAEYDCIAVGTPTWWYTMAPAVKTFLHQQQFSGKTVIPFMTNGGWPGICWENSGAIFLFPRNYRTIGSLNSCCSRWWRTRSFMGWNRQIISARS